MYGKLTVITGSMFSGKTSHLVSMVSESPSVIVFKPAMDIRYAEEEIVTHHGHRAPATPVRLPDDLAFAQDYKLICFDEIQFFSEPYFGGDIVRIIKVFLRAGRDVQVCGLDTDWKGNAFPITASLLAMADDVIKLKSKCAKCGEPATKTYKKSRQGSVVELGNSDTYEARCNHHWKVSSPIS